MWKWVASAFISVPGALFLLFLCLVLLCCIRNFDIVYHYNTLGDFFLKKWETVRGWIPIGGEVERNWEKREWKLQSRYIVWNKSMFNKKKNNNNDNKEKNYYSDLPAYAVTYSGWGRTHAHMHARTHVRTCTHTWINKQKSKEAKRKMFWFKK